MTCVLLDLLFAVRPSYVTFRVKHRSAPAVIAVCHCQSSVSHVAMHAWKELHRKTTQAWGPPKNCVTVGGRDGWTGCDIVLTGHDLRGVLSWINWEVIRSDLLMMSVQGHRQRVNWGDHVHPHFCQKLFLRLMQIWRVFAGGGGEVRESVTFGSRQPVCKLRKMRRICCFAPWPPWPGAEPLHWSRCTRAPPSDPRYRLALHALRVCPSHFFDLETPLW